MDYNGLSELTLCLCPRKCRKWRIELWAFSCFLWARRNSSMKQGLVVGMLLALGSHGPLTFWVQALVLFFIRWPHERNFGFSYQALRHSSVAPQALRGWMWHSPKNSVFSCMGQKTVRPEAAPCRRVPSLVDTYSDLRQAMCPPFRGAFWVAQVSHLYHMNIYDFYTSSNWNNLIIPWKKPGLVKVQ